MNVANMPKVELHLHLDCSLSYTAAAQLEPGLSVADFEREFVAPAKCADLAAYIDCASRSIGLMQTAASLRLATLDLFRQLADDHVMYAEIRFAPLEHIQAGLSPTEVVAAVHAAVVEGSAQTGVLANILLCTLRHYTESQSMETVLLVADWKGSHVVGFDIASDEAGYPITAHTAAFAYAYQAGIPCTAHAGEAAGPTSVWETLQHFKPARIGHGVRSIEDPALLDYLKKHDIHLEICPSSNVQTSVFPTFRDHVVHQLYAQEMSLSVNTDGRTLVNTTLTEEYLRLQNTFGWEAAHFITCNLAAIQHAFTSDAIKDSLRQRLYTWAACAASE